MASRTDSDGAKGCLGILAFLFVLFLVLWTLSAIGHLLGLTPTYSELTDRPDGWVGSHYRGVVWGYILTLVVLGALAALAVLGVRTRSPDPTVAAQARAWLRQTRGPAFGLLLAVVLLPIGQRPGVDKGPGESGSAMEGNVPGVVGLTADRAQQRLGDETLDAEFRETPYGNEDRCRVVSQDPSPGAELEQYDSVALRCVMRVPTVIGMRAQVAERRVSNAGMDVRFVNEPADHDLTRCRVRRQGRTDTAPPDATIGLRLHCRKPRLLPPPPTPEPVSQCDPSYSGCLKPDSPDYDCAGGSGDGPDYTGPVRVVGDDPYDLDRDGDGFACDW